MIGLSFSFINIVNYKYIFNYLIEWMNHLLINLILVSQRKSFTQLIIIIKKFNNRGIIKLNYNEFNKIK